MKIMGVAILAMIVLGVAQVDHKPQKLIESNRLSCNGKCVFECFPLVTFTTLYLLCIQDCSKKCEKGFTFAAVGVPDCNSSCGLINTDNGDVMASVVDSCLQECERRNNTLK
ncbi:hypothetical protein PHAVU_001G008800 [Phaseolus vulgaris]|uniref:Thionin-like protein n=1 Tax=Phaseolus vulgaris TaxID=3885 RepID=V7CTJ9_PHAVU|nr:hypothetical protein PHAVU_001G008800g [Phaseolus vulgaris]ESW32683.1 hypothetical protein PHAVU_001G008800g [Phaseolus vulgaris]